MTLRRYAPLGASRGTVIGAHIRARVLARDKGCVGRAVHFGPEDMAEVDAAVGATA